MNALGKSYLEPPSVKSCIPQKFTCTLYHTFWQGGVGGRRGASVYFGQVFASKDMQNDLLYGSYMGVPTPP